MWKYYTVWKRLLRHDGEKYTTGDSVALDDAHSSTSLLIDQKAIAGPTGDAPDPTIIPTGTAGLPDATELPGEGLIHRDASENWSFADEIESVSE